MSNCFAITYNPLRNLVAQAGKDHPPTSGFRGDLAMMLQALEAMIHKD